MRAKTKKTFELSSIKKYKEYERKLWLIPMGCLLFTVMCPGGQKVFDEFMENPSIATVVGILLFYALGTMVLSVIPFFVARIIIRTGLKTTIENCTITSMQDFEYYRDKLTGLSPAAISILTDLEIEQEKDVAASVLQYENLGLLAEEADHTYRTTEKYDNCSDLNESDRYLIEHLKAGDFDWENDMQWKQLVMEEAVSEGYITSKSFPQVNRQNEEGQKKTGSVKDLLPLVAVLVWILWGASAMVRLQDFQAVLETAPENATLAEQVIFLSRPELLLECIEVIALFIYTMFLISHLIAAPRAAEVAVKNRKTIKRTDYGNQMAECVYGMKNFIHDYSNLNEADRRQVVLWEDYLVYAVVLEENEEIVNEILKTRSEVL